MARVAHMVVFQDRYDATAVVGPVWDVGQSATANYPAITPVDGSNLVAVIGTTAPAANVDAPTGHTQLSELDNSGLRSAIYEIEEVTGEQGAVTDDLGGVYPWMTMRATVNSTWEPNDRLDLASSGHLYDTDGEFTALSYNVDSAVPGHTRYSFFCVIVYDDSTLGIPVVTLTQNEGSFFSLIASQGYNWGTTAMCMYLYGGIAGDLGGEEMEKTFQVNFAGTDFSRAAGSMPQVFGGGMTVA